jgi:hypothetical protein
MIREENAPISFMQERAEKEEATSSVEWWCDTDCAVSPPWQPRRGGGRGRLLQPEGQTKHSLSAVRPVPGLEDVVGVMTRPFDDKVERCRSFQGFFSIPGLLSRG